MISLGYLASIQSLAALFIAAAGACLIIQQRVLAVRLFAIGCVLAAATGLAANTHGANALALWLAALGICAAILGVRHWPIYLIALAIAFGVLLSRLEPIARAFLPFWWLVPLLVGSALVTALIVTIALRRLRERFYRGHPKFAFNRFLASLLDRLTGLRRRPRMRDRHIGEFGTTRRGRSGSGPHMI